MLVIAEKCPDTQNHLAASTLLILPHLAEEPELEKALLKAIKTALVLVHCGEREVCVIFPETNEPVWTQFCTELYVRTILFPTQVHVRGFVTRPTMNPREIQIPRPETPLSSWDEGYSPIALHRAGEFDL